jgi:hypothetical protein
VIRNNANCSFPSPADPDPVSDPVPDGVEPERPPHREAELYQVRNLPESMWTNPDPG